MKVFLTGATGFVGSAVLKRLASAGHSVKGLVQDPGKAEGVRKLGGIPVIGDLLAMGGWREEVKDCDVIVSASSPYHMGEKLSIKEAERRAETHAEEVINLLHAAEHTTKVQAVVLTYHVTAFGNHGDDWVSEVMTVDPVGLARPVAGAYWEIEKTARKLGIKTIEVFPGWVYGPGSWFKGLVDGAVDGTTRIVGAGTNHKSLIHIDDLAEGYKLILDKMPVGERYCLTDGNPITQADLKYYVADELHKDRPAHVDYTQFAHEFGEVMAEAMDSSVRVTNTKAKKELGFKPVFGHFYEGVPDVFDRLGIAYRSKAVHKKASGF